MENLKQQMTELEKIDISYLDAIPGSEMAQEMGKIKTKIKARFHILKEMTEKIESNFENSDEGVPYMEDYSKSLALVTTEMESLTRTVQELVAYSESRLNPH